MKGLDLILSLSLWHRACEQGRFAVHTASNRTTASLMMDDKAPPLAQDCPW
jgi:hypothetical protein